MRISRREQCVLPAMCHVTTPPSDLQIIKIATERFAKWMLIVDAGGVANVTVGHVVFGNPCISIDFISVIALVRRAITRFFFIGCGHQK